MNTEDLRNELLDYVGTAAFNVYRRLWRPCCDRASRGLGTGRNRETTWIEMKSYV